MNYWLNDKLKNKNISSPFSVEKFFNKIKVYDNNFDKEKFLLGKIYELNDDVLENMRLLHNIYDKYYKIYRILEGKATGQEESCLSYFYECINEYKYAKIKCIVNNNSKFCEALDEFKDNYKLLYHKSNELVKCNMKEIKELPTQEEIVIMYHNLLKNVKNEKHSTTAVVGSFLGLFSTVTLFYKVTKIYL
ncbi:hypothetical protein PVMG_04850 [Plasmodium vivax Mauritania I]|uniref:Variable surface protein n=1 Tax=Plasmodium vivax Mauritania I TaxID=1035515 RepID=A0A0J9VU14_PLAVI|nr:hypothetical protein PVMG_04850 [Plasmodium vivax Mauritania I]